MRLFLVLAAVAALVGCSGSTCNPPAVQKPTLLSLSLGPPYATLPAGYSQQYVVTAIYSDGSKQQLSPAQLGWSSSNAAAATMSTLIAGTANTLSPGETTIKVTFDGISADTTLQVTPAVLVSIEVSPTGASVPAGVEEPLQATGVYSDGSTHDITGAVTWNSSAPAIAGVSAPAANQAAAKTLLAGTTVITASLGGISGTTHLTVTPPTLVSIAVTPASSSLPQGLTQSYVATGTYSDGSHANLTTSVTWTSSVPGAATIASQGLATAASVGSTTIAASLGGVSGSTGLTVTAPKVVSISVTPSTANAPKGTQQQLTAVATFSDGTTQVITAQAVWSTSNATTASISNAGQYSGLTTALSPGASTVTATYEGISGSTSLTVTAAALQSIEVTPSHSSIANGTNEAFTATGIYTDGTTQNLTQTATWSTSAPAIASISNAAGTNGLALAASVGSTTITATQGGLSGSTPLTVTAATLVSLTVTPATAAIANGTTQQFTVTGTYTDNSTQNLTTTATWSSSATSIATVSNAAGSNGLATSAGVGNSTITASIGTLSANGALTVSAATLTSITVTPATASVAAGYSAAFTATGHYTDQSTQNLTNSVTWTSTAQSYATISNTAGSQGVAAGVAVGSTTITAAQNGISGTASLNVTAAVLVSIAVTPASPTVFVGVPESFVATGTYSDGSTQNITASPSLVWASSTPAVGTESNAAGTQGQLTPLTVGSTSVSATVGSISGSSGAVSVALQEYAYTLNAGSTANSISTYLVGNSGSLTPLGSTAVGSGGTQPFSAVIDSTRGNMYVTNIAAANYLTQFSIGANGTLTQTATYNNNFFNPAYLTMDRTNSYLYVANLDNPSAVNEYQIGTNGALTYLGSVSQGFNTPYHLVVDPSNRWLYVLSAATGAVAQYSIDSSTGQLSYVSVITIPNGGMNAMIPELIAIDASGTHAYVSAQYNNVQNTTNGEVMDYSIDQASGNLTLVNTVAAGVYARSVLIDPTGTHVYVANVYGDSISEYSVDPVNGLQLLTTIGTGAGSNPSALNLDPTGQYVYASLGGTNSIIEYSFNPDGTLNFLSSTATGSGPDWVSSGN